MRKTPGPLTEVVRRHTGHMLRGGLSEREGPRLRMEQHNSPADFKYSRNPPLIVAAPT
jgi:hypothetical protein